MQNSDPNIKLFTILSGVKNICPEFCHSFIFFTLVVNKILHYSRYDSCVGDR